MKHRHHLALAVVAFVLSACSGGSDVNVEADGTSTTGSSTTTTSTTTSSTTGDDSTSSTESTTTSTETTTTTAQTTTTEETNEYALALAPDGLIVVEQASGSTNTLPFGSAQSIVVNAVTDLLGPPSETNAGSVDCGNGQDGVAIWDDAIMLEFAESSFIGWSLRQRSTLTTSNGIGLGTTLATLRSGLSVTVDESTLGTEFATTTDEAGFGGLLTDDTDSAVVSDLWAGSICVFR